MVLAHRLRCDWITYAARSNVLFRPPMADLASSCGIASTQTPQKHSITFDLTGSEGRHPKLLYMQQNLAPGLLISIFDTNCYLCDTLALQ
jgi:hypothetical protein